MKETFQNICTENPTHPVRRQLDSEKLWSKLFPDLSRNCKNEGEYYSNTLTFLSNIHFLLKCEEIVVLYSSKAIKTTASPFDSKRNFVNRALSHLSSQIILSVFLKRTEDGCGPWNLYFRNNHAYSIRCFIHSTKQTEVCKWSQFALYHAATGLDCSSYINSSLRWHFWSSLGKNRRQVERQAYRSVVWPT